LWYLLVERVLLQNKILLGTFTPVTLIIPYNLVFVNILSKIFREKRKKSENTGAEKSVQEIAAISLSDFSFFLAICQKIWYNIVLAEQYARRNINVKEE